MKIAVIGAGAIGALVAGYLKSKGEDVILIGRPDAVKVIKKNGLEISGCRGDLKIEIDAVDRLNFYPDLAILATKSHDLEAVVKENLKFLQESLIVTTQNGVQADFLIAKLLPKENIISSIVMFGSTYLEPGKIIHNFEGSWVLGRIFQKNDEGIVEVSEILDQAFPTIVAEDIKGMKYLKVFVNANNCIPAILGLSMQEAFQDLEISRIAIAIWKEGLNIVNKLGINLISLPDFPVERLTKLTALSTVEAAKIYSGIMVNLSKVPLYGSILQSIKRGKFSEIDYINGEFVTLAKNNNLSAPLNEKLVEMVHSVERNDKFFSKEDLINNTKGLFN